MSSHVVRALDESEVEKLIDWAAAEGWNPGLNDASAFRSADPEGFIGAFVDGEMAAGISAVAYGATFGFIGLYIVRPDMRGKGYGKAVWDAGMARLAGRTVGLDGVDQQFENYRRKGFMPAYRTVRFGGRFGDRPDEILEVPLAAVGPRLIREIVAFDRKSFPEARNRFVERWLAPPHIARAALSGGDRVIGYGVIRKCRTGWKVGGLSAVDGRTAAALVRSLAAEAGDEDIFIDVPAARERFMDFLTEAGLLPGFETTRMYRGGIIPLAPELYGVTTLELG